MWKIKITKRDVERTNLKSKDKNIKSESESNKTSTEPTTLLASRMGFIARGIVFSWGALSIFLGIAFLKESFSSAINTLVIGIMVILYWGTLQLKNEDSKKRLSKKKRKLELALSFGVLIIASIGIAISWFLELTDYTIMYSVYLFFSWLMINDSEKELIKDKSE